MASLKIKNEGFKDPATEGESEGADELMLMRRNGHSSDDRESSEE